MQPEKMALVSTNASPEELILRNFAATIGRKRYEHWFQKQTQVWIEGDEVVVAVATPFLVSWMSQNFRAGLLAAARPVMGDDAEIRFQVRTDSISISVRDTAPATAGSVPASKKTVRVDTNVTGNYSSNLEAHVATRLSVSAEDVKREDVKTGGVTTRGKPGLVDSIIVEPEQQALPNETSSESLRLMCQNSHATHTPPAPVSLKLAVAAASIAIQSTIPSVTSAKSAPESNVQATGRTAPRQTGFRQAVPQPNVANEKIITPKSQSNKPTAEKPVTEKAVASVSRITKDSPLTVAKVKAVAEPQRNHRRYADLMDLVEGTCNEFALSAARQVCQAPGVQFTSLFVHGPVGVGKTHMLEGIHRQLKQSFPSRQVAYLTAEAFANFFTQALRDHKLPSFRQKFRSIDVLIVDDIDFLDGKRGIQEEFLFTVQQLESHGRVVVVAAHGHPRLLTKMSDELRTRFLAGMVCRIDAPDVATRRRIIENKALRAGADFASDVFQFVADRFRNNVRELEGAFNTLLAHQRMAGRRLSLTAARNALADLERDCIRVVRIVDIEQAVCTMFGITTDDLKSAKRQQSVSQPRMLAMYLARKHTRAAYTEIGQHFGGRNHSTVMAAEKKIRASLTGESPMVIHTQSWRVSDLIETLEQQLQAS